ncbi:SMP-30/gluconolactonase/LRE family protein [Actinosynnema sp. CA-299493]
MRRRSIIALAATAGAVALLPAPAAADPHAAVVRSRVAVHFDLASGQTPENVALAPDGTAYVTFAVARQVAAVSPAGVTRILATLPAPADGGVRTPVLGFPLTTGIVRTHDGTLYYLYASGDPASTGLYRLRHGGAAQRIAALPADGLPNGLALDDRAGTFYVTDSVLGTITTVPLRGGTAAVWSAAPELAATGFLGANGVKVRGGAVWATNLDQGTVLRIPVRRGGPGDVEVRARGLVGIDDFAFAGGDVLAALNGPNQVVRIAPDGAATVLLTSADGLRNPTSVAVRGRTAYVLSAAYSTAADPNLLLAKVR